jgi:cytosine deaminase
MPVAPFFAAPRARDYWLADARLVEATLAGPPPRGADDDGLARADLRIVDDRIAAIAPRGTAPESAASLGGGMILPGFVDIHTHLDKGHIWPRRPNPDGSWDGAIAAVIADKNAAWSIDDVERRFDFALRAAYAHGTVAVRSHIESNPERADMAWGLFRRMREAWRGRIELQASSILPSPVFTRAYAPKLADLVAAAGGHLGLVLRMGRGPTPIGGEEIEQAIDLALALATERGLDLDLHVDETDDPNSTALYRLARAAVKRRFKGRIVAGHCCSLATQSDAVVAKTLAAAADAGIAIVSLPMCNLYLMDRQAGRTPRWRGVTLVHEAKAAGLPVAFASDNTRDPFYGYGDLDMLEVFREASRIAHLDRPFGDWPRAFAAVPAELMRLADRGRIKVGAPADLVLFKGRSFDELLSRPQADRVVLRAGRAIEATPPDYAELDDLFRKKARGR